MTAPSAVRVRMYQVGFGDCFLVSFEYPGQQPDERHMLIDFGRKYKPHAGGDMTAVAKDIKARTGGRLDLVVVSHRHTDHLSGFGGTSTAQFIEDCDPALVVRSWTERPNAPNVAPGQSLAAADRRFIGALDAAGNLAEEIAGSRFALERTVVGRSLRRFAFEELKNQDAVKRLNRWSKGGRGAYLSFGSGRLANVLPGVEIEVLGPPTVKQYPAIAGEANSDPDYWLALRRQLPVALDIAGDAADGDDAGDEAADEPGDGSAAAATAAGLATELAAERGLDAGGGVPVLATAPDAGTPRTARPEEEGHASDAVAPGAIGPVRWLTEKLRKQQVASLLRIVRSLDDWLNNTSLILLIRAGDRRLLFPGDAQVENWRYALKAFPDETERDRIRAELAQVDLYKVGHHGSRNATPRSLFELWTPSNAPHRPVVSLMSSKEGEYGESVATAVPLAKLVNELAAGPRRLVSTLQDPANPDPTPFHEVWAPTTGAGSFQDA